MKSASRSLSISSQSASFRSIVNRCGLCFTGHAFGCTDNLCSIMSLGTLGISDGLQEKTSVLARRKVMSASLYLESRPAPIRIVLDGSESFRQTTLSRSSGLVMTWTFTGRPLGSAFSSYNPGVSSSMSRLLLSQYSCLCIAKNDDGPSLARDLD